MLKNILKRTLSTLLVLMLVATTFFIFDPSFLLPTAEAAVSATSLSSSSYSDVYFVVPEVIYLQPVYNAQKASTTSTFKYYVNNSLSGATWGTTAEVAQETGKVWFYYANTSSANISFKWETTPGTASSATQTITFGNSTAKAPGTSYALTSSNASGNYMSITAGNCPSLGSTTTGIYIKWIAEFTDSVDGQTKQAIAYTYVYKPYVYPMASAIKGACTRSGNHWGQSIGWISGVHACNNTSDKYPTVNTSKGLLPIAGGGTTSSDATALLSSYFKMPSGNTGCGDWVGGSSTDSEATSHYYYGGDKNGCGSDEYVTSVSYSGNGRITVDSSRYTDMSQIPNLTVGLMVTDDDSSDSGGTYFVSNNNNSYVYGATSDFRDYWNTNQNNDRAKWDTPYNAAWKTWGSRSNMNASEGEGLKFNLKWSLATPSSGQRYVVVGYGNHKGGRQIFNVHNLRCYVYTWSKADLRTAYQNAIKSMAMNNEKLLKSAKWSTFLDTFQKVAAQLCKVDQTAYSTVTANGTSCGSASALKSEMNTVISNCKTFSTDYRDQYTARQKNIKVYNDSGWKLVSNNDDKTATHWKGAKVTFSSESYTGYTYKGYRTAAESQTTAGSATTGQSNNMTSGNYEVAHATSDTTVYYYYLANTYTVTLNQQSGSGGSDSVTATYGRPMPSATMPTRTGYNFGGYYTSTGGGGTQYYNSSGGSAKNWDKTSATTLYAKWTGKTYTVTFNKQSGSGGSDSVTATYGSAMPSATAPSRAGYDFNGYWTSTGSSGTQYYNSSCGSAKNWDKTEATTLYAGWTIHTSTLTVAPAGGTWSGSSNNQSFTQNYGTTKTIGDPTRSGYSFTGWTLSSGANGSFSNGTYTFGAAKGTTDTLTAGWSLVTYTITYDLKGGTLASGVTNPSSYNVTTTAFTLNNPGKTGYTFAGWTGTGISGSSTSVTVAKGSTGNRSYTATWTANGYTVTLDPKFYSSSSATGVAVTSNGSTSASPTYASAMPNITVPTYTGYTFGGYWTSKTGTGTQYYKADGTSNRNWDIANSTTTLYAKWTIVTYTISYTLNSGSLPSGQSNPTSYTITSSAITLVNPTRTGYDFAGWTGTGLSDATATVTIPKGSTGNRAYTATWEAISYTISYNLDGGSVASSNPGSYTVATATFTLNNPTKTGYTFKGWSGTDLTGDSNTSVSVPKGSTGNRSYTANWTGIQYSVTLDPKFYSSSTASGVAVTSNGSTSASPTFGSAMPNITVPTYTGYTFGGYWTSKTGTGTQYYKADGTSNRNWDIANSTTTLYAKWTIVTYTISYTLNSGTVASANPTSYNVKTATFTLNNPTRSGYSFKGWSGTGLTGDQNTTVTIAQGSTGNRSYTANWTIVTYTISYEGVSGVTWGTGTSTTNPNYTTYQVTTGTFTLTNPKKTGHTFTGWTGGAYQTATLTAKVTKGSTGDITFTAHWSADSYTLKFSLAGGSLTAGGGFSANTDNQTKSITYGSTYGASDGSKTWPNNPTKTGYTFQGWKKDGTAYTSSGTVSVTADLTVTADWSLDTYTIGYSLDSGSLPSGQSNPTSYTYTSNAITLVNPTRTGYTFLGWTGTGLSSASTSVTIPAGSTGNRSYTATWQINSSTLTVAPAGGTWSGSTSNQSFTQNYNETKSIADPTRTGYDFTGWTLSANANGSFSSGTYTFGPAKNVTDTLTAGWNAKSYTVTLDMQSGTGGTTSVSAEYGSAMPSATMPTRIGYDFAGYWTATGGSGTKYYNADGTSAKNWDQASNKTLYAAWTIHTSKLKVDPNGGTWSSSTSAQTFTQNYNTTKSLGTDPTRTGYTFTGWTLSANANGSYNSTSKTYTFGPAKNVTDTLTAGWDAVNYTISYKEAVGGGNITGVTWGTGTSTTNPNYTSYTVATDTFTLTDPKKTGYTFAGWTGGGYDTATTPAQVTKGTTGNITFSANWTANTYTLKFVLNGGSLTAGGGFIANQNNQTKTVTYGSTYGASDGSKTWPNNPTKDGYDFAGWKNGSNTYGSSTTVSYAGDLTVTADWSEHTYNISYNLANGALETGVTNPTTYKITSAAITLNNPKRTGYDFTGWTGTGISSASDSVTIPTGSFGDRSYTATWTAHVYSISYTLNNGTLPSGQTNPTTYKITDEDITLVNPSKTGYKFDGWTGTGLSAATLSVTITSGSYGDRSYTANFTANKYTVTFNKQSGTGGSNSVSATFGSNMPSATMPTRDGYTFGGYFTGTSGSGTQYYTASGSSARTWNIAQATTLYAKWTPTGYTITFIANDSGVTSVPDDMSYNIESTSVALPDCSRNGYTLDYWQPTDDYGNWDSASHDYVAGFSVNGMYGDVELKAKWTAVSYSITFDENGGSEVNDVSSYYITTALTLPTPTRTGYTFGGWKPTANVGNWSTSSNYTGSLAKGKYGTVTLKAQWTAKTFKLTFALDGGSLEAGGGFSANTDNQQKTVTYDKKYNVKYNSTENKTWPNNPTKTGYTFGGWYTDTSDATTLIQAEDTVQITAATTVTAKWNIVTYTITYTLNSGALASGQTNPTSYTIEDDPITLYNPTRTGYTFKGWSGTGLTGDENTSVTIPTGSSGNRTYTANWNTITYTISYTLNDGVLPSGKTNPSNYTIETETITLNNPVKEGYEFRGWTGSNGTSPQTTVKITKGSTGNKEYAAEWRALTYTVTLDRQGGTTGSTSVTATFGSAMPSMTKPGRTGYDFGGYFTERNGAGTKYYNADGSSAHTWDKANNTTTLYAMWTATTYTIGYTLAGGSLPSGQSNPTSYTIESDSITLINPTRDGYTFGGWTGTGLGSASSSVTIPTGSTGDRAYTATWNTITYTISYNLNGGTVATANPTTYNVETPTFTLNNPGKGGYDFAGWTGTGLASMTTTAKVNKGGIGNRSYEAHWTAKSYTLYFDSDEGEDVDPLPYTPDDNYTLGSTTKPGYNFDGWKVTTAAGNWTANAVFTATDTVEGMYGNAWLTAQWAVKSYTLTVSPNGGTWGGSTNNQTFTQAYLTTKTMNGNVTRTGYTFAGWALTAGAGTYTPNSDPKTGGTFTFGVGNGTLTAQWNTIDYTISYVYPSTGVTWGSENASSNPNKTTFTVETATFTLVNPNRTGYTFTGWTGGGYDTAETSVTIVRGTTGNRTYTANWSANIYPITFDKQGGAGGSDSVRATFGSAMPSAVMPERAGYTFGGYYSGTNGSGTKYYNANGSSARSWNSTTINKLYAQWTAQTYTLTFNPGGGYFAADGSNDGGFATGEQQTEPQSKQVTYDQLYGDADATGKTWPAAMLRAGYTFNGWKSGNKTFLPGDTVDITGPTTISAQWTNKTFYLAFDMNGVSATAPATKTLSYNMSNTYADEPTNVSGGWTFRGWSESSTTTSGTVAAAGSTIQAETVNTWFSVGEGGTKTVYAIWEKTLTATFKDGQGADQTSSTKIYNGAASGTVAVKTQRDNSGWTKMGWTTSTASDATGNATATSFTISADTTYYGRYDRTVKVQYNSNGGSAAPADTEVTQQTNANDLSTWTNSTATLAGAVTRDGYTFAGWKIGTTTYNAGATYTITANVTAVAQWTLRAFTVTIDPNDGVVSEVSYYLTGTTAGDLQTTDEEISEPTSLTMVHSTTATIAIPQRNGYAFDGWAITATNGGTLPSDCVAPTDGSESSTYVVGAANVTLTATWRAENYVLRYSSGIDDTVLVKGTYAYDATVTLENKNYVGNNPGYSFMGWVPSADPEQIFEAGQEFNLSELEIDFADLDVDDDGHPTVIMTAEWVASLYQIAYDTNGKSLSNIISAGRYNTWTWRDSAGDATLSMEGDESIQTYSAYSTSTSSIGTGSYFYLNSTTETRFGLGWGFRSGDTTVAVDFDSPLTIDMIPPEVLSGATVIDEDENLYEITLYMVWSLNYKDLEHAVSQFQSTFMTFANGARLLRGRLETGYPVYTDAPTSAKLPTVVAADNAYKANGVEADAIWSSRSDPEYARYSWAVGKIGDASSWTDLENDDRNDFTSGSVGNLNTNYQDIINKVIYDPCAQFAAGAIKAEGDTTVSAATSSLTAVTSAYQQMVQNNYRAADMARYESCALVSGLRLRDVDLDKRLSDEEMAAFNDDFASYTINDEPVDIDFGEMCATSEDGGMSYRPDEDTAQFLNEVFGEELLEMYPPCETDEDEEGTPIHHSFNSMLDATEDFIGLANEIFALFGFDPMAERDPDADCFMSDSINGLEVDEDPNSPGYGYVINPDCPYTTKSVYELFDLIYGYPADNTYKSMVADGINEGQVALYYQVKDQLGEDASVILRRPSQEKLDKIVTLIAYGYHNLEMDRADYSNFVHLFQEYFDATWGVRLGSVFPLGTDYLTAYAGYFTQESYNRLDEFMRSCFSSPGQLKSTFEYLPGVEQNMVDGRPEDENYVRQYPSNHYIPYSEVQDNLDAFNFAEGTLCDTYCDLIDALVPEAADYSDVFELIASNFQLQTDSDSYMVDYRDYATVTDFYPSSASDVATNYQAWWSEYAYTNAWTRTRTNGLPAYDTVWMYKFFSQSSVDALKTVIGQINWSYNKLNQHLIDKKNSNGEYAEGTICYQLKKAIRELEPKKYYIDFYQGLNVEESNDWLSELTFYYSGDTRKDYHYGMNVFSNTVTPDPQGTEHKTFMGWFTTKNAGGYTVSASDSNLLTVDMWLDEDLLGDYGTGSSQATVTATGTANTYMVKVYARWVDNVTLNIVVGEGGSVTVKPEGEDPFTVTHTQNTTASYEYGKVIEFTSTPQKQGYHFKEWSFEPGDSIGSVFNATNSTYTFGYARVLDTVDTLTVVWEPNTYTVVFNQNNTDAGSTGTMQPQSFTYDEAQQLTANAFTRPGYSFTSWNTEAGGTGDTYTNRQPVTNLTNVNGGTVTLYAQWELADFNLVFTSEFATPDWYDASLATYQWTSWDGVTPAGTQLTKKITFGETYSKADENSKTWPSNPKIVYEITDDVEVNVTFLGWFTAASGGTQILAGDTVSVTGDQRLYPHFDFQRTKIVKEKVELVLEYMDANKYTLESMLAVDQILIDILDNEDPNYVPTDADIARLNAAIENLEPSDDETESDVTPPSVSVYENKAALQRAIADGTFTGDVDDYAYMLREDVGEVNYVYPGKAYYTYYCYTNDLKPAIIIDAKDIIGTNGRVSYPTRFTDTSGIDHQIDASSGIVKSGWMNYTYDNPSTNESGRNAEYDIIERMIANPYASELKYFGMNYGDGTYANDTGYNFYTHEQYVMLKPTFVQNGGKQFALYKFIVHDDSYNDLPADTISLAGAAGDPALSDGMEITTAKPEVTPVHAVTIFVEYNNTMNGERTDNVGQVASNGVGTYGGSYLEVYNNFHENGYQDNKWVSVDYLYRNAAGIANTDFVGPMLPDESGHYSGYLANDPIYGQTDVGSFYYLMKSDDPATIKYWDEYDKYLDEHPGDYAGARVAGATAFDAKDPTDEAALDKMKALVIEDMKDPTVRAQMNSTAVQASHVENGAYIYWPYSGSTQWFTQFYAPARTREDTLVYVHIYDRWGNTYTNILQRDLQDTQVSQASAIARGEVVVSELGGSGVKNISICELNTKKKITVSGMTDEGTYNMPSNMLTITGLPEGKNGYRYTMRITDNAGSEQAINFQASSDGTVVVTINDETMGGSYAQAASAPLPTSQIADQTNGIGIGMIEEADVTTLTVEEVTPDEIGVNTIEQAQVDQAAPVEHPSIYTFTLNDEYTVNLFADVDRDYEVTLKSTAGGTVKAYVNGEFAPAKSGKVTVPAGSHMQIRVTAKTGYELESLTMYNPNGSTVNLVGAYNTVINDDVTIKAVFVETEALLTIRVENGAVSGKQELLVSPYSRVTAVAAAAPEGQTFAYWAQNGADDVPVSYDEIYTFVATSDVDLKAIYSDAPVEQTASIVMDAPSATHVNVVNGAYALSYSGRITVPEGAEIEEFGLVLTNQSGDSCTADNLVIGGKVNGTSVVKIAGQTLTDEGQCKINVNNVAEGQTRTGRLYLTVRLADGTTQTIYSNTWSELTTPAA